MIANILNSNKKVFTRPNPTTNPPTIRVKSESTICKNCHDIKTPVIHDEDVCNISKTEAIRRYRGAND